MLYSSGRYAEAIREFNKILLYILKYKQYHQKSPQYDQILKKNEQMYALLAVCLSLCPQHNLIDENVSTQLKEKYNDKMTKMQRFDEETYAAYDELFSYACPKFITPSPPALDQPLTNYNQVMLLVLNNNVFFWFIDTSYLVVTAVNLEICLLVFGSWLQLLDVVTPWALLPSLHGLYCVCQSSDS